MKTDFGDFELFDVATTETKCIPGKLLLLGGSLTFFTRARSDLPLELDVCCNEMTDLVTDVLLPNQPVLALHFEGHIGADGFRIFPEYPVARVLLPHLCEFRNCPQVPSAKKPYFEGPRSGWPLDGQKPCYQIRFTTRRIPSAECDSVFVRYDFD